MIITISVGSMSWLLMVILVPLLRAGFRPGCVTVGDDYRLMQGEMLGLSPLHVIHFFLPYISLIRLVIC